MNIGIITFHFAYNPGAVLQCYALQTYLQSLGCEVQIINYRPWYHQNIYTPFRNPFQTAKSEYERCIKSSVKWKSYLRGGRFFLGTIKSWTKYQEVIECEQKYRAFIEENLNETIVYRTLKRLQKKPPKCDLYICGSDQIWNRDLTNGEFDLAYFLEFGGNNVRRLSYAVGMVEFPRNDYRIHNALSLFENISLREDKFQHEAVELYGEKVPVCVDVDPTLLLEKKDYQRLLDGTQHREEPYILTYVLPDESGKRALREASKLSKKLGIPVINICGKKYEGIYDKTEAKYSGPDDFLWYISNAEYVFTNSFHCTIFSLLYHKDFIAIPHTKTGDRIRCLLKKVDLLSRCVEDNSVGSVLFVPIDYEMVDERLKAYREISHRHLREWILKEQ